MSYLAALPNHFPQNLETPVLTFIVPAPQGCNLKCPYCYIGRRNEAARREDLTPADFVAFIEQIAAREDVGAICIQGYEPLLPESFSYTRDILRAGQLLGIPTSLVTNGTYLDLWVNELDGLEPDRIAVSLDSAEAAVHDKLRGKEGAFQRTMNSLRLVYRHPKLRSVTVVASVLMPRKRKFLHGMPKLLSVLGAEQWIVTALSQVGKDKVGGPVGKRVRTLFDLLVLKDEAERHNIELTVDDEFDRLTTDDFGYQTANDDVLSIRRLAQPSGVFRLLPTGQCSMGLDILKEVGLKTPVWHPGTMHAWDFIERMRNERQMMSAVD